MIKIILALLIAFLGILIIQTKLVKTLMAYCLDSLKHILLWIYSILHRANRAIDKLKKYPERQKLLEEKFEIEKTEPSKNSDLGVFLFFSMLTATTAGYLLSYFKRKVVGDGPFTEPVIKLIEIDLTDYLPKSLRK